jgi:outer membrane protein insertion porin family
VITSKAGYSLEYSTIDNRLDPHNGLGLKFRQDFAGLGGDTQYMQTTGEARYYREIFPDQDVVAGLKVGAGNITGLGQDVRILDNFFQGGETIRGFANYGYGPVDTKTGVPIGGKNYWVASAEVQFPLPGISPEFGLRGAVFADAGTLWGVDVPTGAGPITDSNVIRSSTGASILWTSPIGMLRGDIAYALTKAATDRTQLFRFSAGKTF